MFSISLHIENLEKIYYLVRRLLNNERPLKMKNNILCLYISAILISISFASCKKNVPKFGLLLPMKTYRYDMDIKYFTERIKELGGETISMVADNDAEKQVDQVKELLNKGVDVLVLCPVNRFTSAAMVRAAHSKNVPVISYTRLIANCDVDYFVSFDVRDIGAAMAKFAIKQKPEGNYVILAGDKGDINAIWESEGVDRILDPSIKSGKIKIAYKTYLENWGEDEANFELRQYLRLSQTKPDVVITYTDDIAIGAIKALKHAKFEGNITLTTEGPNFHSCKNILNRDQSMSVIMPVPKLAAMTAEVAFSIAKGDNVSKYFATTTFNDRYDVPSFFLDVTAVDASNIGTFVAAGTMFEKDYTSQ